MDAGDTENIAPNSPVFAVYYPDDIKNSPRVFYQSVKEAAKFANSPEGRIRGARFRRFGNSREAATFYESGDGAIPTPTMENKAAAADPVVAFPSVSRIEMNKLKKAIESDNFDDFLKLIDPNPRFLINTSGDTAAIVQEGFRFNSLHIAARNGSSRIADYILKCVSDTDYLIRLYGTNESDADFRKENILISYLNTPDKGNGDTPLHLASKWGHAEVARIIASYHQTIRDFKNKNNEIPLDVVCSRYTGEKKEETARRLRTILHSYYVALYRCSDHSLPTRWKVCSFYPLVSLSPSLSPHLLNSPFSPILAPFLLTAVAGPFENEENAIQFQRRWKAQGLDRRRADFDRGAEKVGREMASEDGVEWVESWPFHSQPIDIKSNYGLEMMEKYLKKKIVCEDDKRRGMIDCDEKKDTNEDEYEDAQEEWDSDLCGVAVSGWTEGDSLGSLNLMMQSLTMSDQSVVESPLDGEYMEIEEEDEEESIDAFVTPPSSPPPLFLDESPSKVDSDLFEVLSSLDQSDVSKYPFIKRFLSSMNGLEGCKRCNLPSLTSPRYWENSPRSRINKRVPRRNMAAELNDLP